MPASYPFFNCVSCRVRVQQVIPYEAGSIPSMIVGNRFIKLSSGFDKGDFTLHCRAQGKRYGTPDMPAYMDFVEGHHYNFDDRLKGMCCFCALSCGIGSELFLTVACFHCKRKEMLRAEFSKLYKVKGVCWDAHGWAALPSAVLDNILRHFVGGNLPIVDGCVTAKEAASAMETC